jgi:hypothetical protein
MVAANRVETNSQSPAGQPVCKSTFRWARRPLHVRAMALNFAAIYAKDVLGVHQARVNARLGRRQCRFYSEGRSSGRTFVVASAVRASVFIGSRILLPNAQPCDPSSWVNFEITIRENKAGTKPPPRIRSISSGCQAGRARRSSPGKLFLQALPGRPVISPRSS